MSLFCRERCKKCRIVARHDADPGGIEKGQKKSDLANGEDLSGMHGLGHDSFARLSTSDPLNTFLSVSIRSIPYKDETRGLR